MSVRNKTVVLNQDGSQEYATISNRRVCNGWVWYLLQTKSGEVWRREDAVRTNFVSVSTYQAQG